MRRQFSSWLSRRPSCPGGPSPVWSVWESVSVYIQDYSGIVLGRSEDSFSISHPAPVQQLSSFPVILFLGPGWAPPHQCCWCEGSCPADMGAPCGTRFPCTVCCLLSLKIDLCVILNTSVWRAAKSAYQNIHILHIRRYIFNIIPVVDLIKVYMFMNIFSLSKLKFLLENQLKDKIKKNQ